MFNIKAFGTIGLINFSNDKGIMTSQLKVKDILNIYRIDSTINRDLSYNRLPQIIKYIESLDGNIGVFLPSLVFSFPENPHNYYSPQVQELTIPPDIKLTVIDGQHRIKSFEKMVSTITDNEKKQKVLESYMTVQIYFGLNRDDERRLFSDINSNARRVSMSLVTSYDTRDIMNILVNEIFNSSSSLQAVQIEFNKSKILRPRNTHFSTSVRIKKFISILLFGKRSLSNKNEAQVKKQYDDLFSFLDKFFSLLFGVLPNTPGDVLQYVLGHESLQNALALHLHNKIIIDCESEITWIDNWEEEIELLGLIDWSIRNTLWHPHMIIARKNSPYEFKAFVDSRHNDLLEILQSELG
ncbi:DNA sulfur modification protein DndB [Brevibacillus sp. DP1.3A]|uniref:DNA sulfur modification protein DndB n=1 Tax=Brevibacillus sp. DP1.3A TaxID=2738867 RepID=UPI00156BA5F8|nr:DNA sulfur modification protein DndB [Brevibacillus sp. DP1.3A]UED75442.1 DGQHR domain-containing protein [Brevibacillus sp. DP1.3A]